MRSNRIPYNFIATPWQHNKDGGWYFVSLPKQLSKEIRCVLKFEEEGWGRLKAVAKLGQTEWRTAIWFDTKMDTYLLPLKFEIRRKENITSEKLVKITIWI